MKILKKNEKQGSVKLIVETADDIWYLYTIIDKGDRCTGESEYKYKLGDEKTRAVRKRVWVTISVDKTEFSSGQLRIGGSVVDGTEEVPRSSHHGLDIVPGDRLELTKDRWLSYHKEKLKEAVKSANLKTLLLLFDREKALFALLKPNGYETLLELKGSVPKKGFDERKTGSFYKEIVEKLVEYEQRHGLHRAIAASPSFWKEYLRKELPADLQKKVIFAVVSAVDESAINELLSRPELKQALEGERSAREVALTVKMMEMLSKDRLVYGMKDLRQAIENGNLSELGVSENHILTTRENDTFNKLEKLMRSASDIGAKVHLFSTDDAKQKLDGLGGVAGITRW